MAHGDVVLQDRNFQHLQLIDALSGTNNGVWVDTRNYATGSLDLIISASGTCQIMGSDEAAKPADASDGRAIGTAITASGIYSITELPAWLKVKVTANTGTVNVAGVLRPAIRSGQ